MHTLVQIAFVKNPADARPDPDIDLAVEMKRSGFSAICQDYILDTPANAKTGEYDKDYLQALAFENRLLARNHMRKLFLLEVPVYRIIGA